MSTPEQRFEVPPEYAEVYERAYRRAYEEGQGQLSGTQTSAQPRRASSRGRRIAVPEQRTSHRAAPQRAGPRAAQRAGLHTAPLHSVPQRAATQHSTRKPTARVIPPVATKPARNAGHRAVPRGGSTLYPVIGLIGLAALLMVGAFLLGRATAATVSQPEPPQTGTGPGATASASRGPPSTATTPSGSPSATSTREVYRGPLAPVRIAAARAWCVAPAGRDGRNRWVSYAVRNVLDKDPRTAWRCAGTAVGKELVVTVSHRSELVMLGLVPGYAKTDPATGVDRYAENNRITRVAWIFDDGTRVLQTMSGSAWDRSLRKLRIVAVRTRTVTLRILAVAKGPKNTTMISSVRLFESARGSD